MIVSGVKRPSRASSCAPIAGERPRDAVDRAAADALVAVERPAPALGLPGKPAGQQPQQRAGVADVDRRAGLRAAQARAVDDEVAAAGAVADVGAERDDRVERRLRVRGLQVVA